jgi:hypothetical protein
MRCARFGMVLVVAALFVAGVRADDWKHAYGTVDRVQSVTNDTGYVIVDVENADGSGGDEAFVVTEDTTIDIVFVNKDGKVVARDPASFDDLYHGEHVRLKYNADNYHAIKIHIVVHV